MFGSSAGITIVYAIIQFYCFIPVVLSRTGIEVVITRCFGWIFCVRSVFSAVEVDIRTKLLAYAIIEIIVAVEGMVLIVISSKIKVR